MRKTTITTTLLALLMLPMALMAQMPAPLPIDPAVRHGKLDNGLTYFIRHNEEPRERANFYIAQMVGSVQEEEEQRGLAHFLEHMCFNGTTHFPGNRIVQYCESIGVKFGENLNAGTSTDRTVYNIDDVPVTESNIDSCLMILRDWSDGLLLEGTEIDKERGVIHEEWRMRTTPQQRVLNRQLETLYPGSRYGRRMPIGLMSVIDNFDYDFLRAYYKKWYRPDLQGIVVVGDFDVDVMEQKIKDTFSSIVMPDNAAPYELYPVPDNDEPIYVVDADKEQRTAIVQVMFKHEPLSYEMNKTQLIFVQNAVWNVVCGAINQRLSELSQKADCPYLYAVVQESQYLLSKTCNAFNVICVPKLGQEAQAVYAVMSEVERARRFGITPTEIARAKEEMMSEVEKVYNNRDKRRSVSYAHEYVEYFLMGNAIPGIELEYQLTKAISQQLPDQVFSQALAQATESITKNLVALAILPEREGVALPKADDIRKAVEDARAAELEAYVDNVKDEPLVAQLPAKGKITKEADASYGYKVWTLSNGARLFFKQTDFNDSEVLLTAVSAGGSRLYGKEYDASIKLFGDVISSTGIGNFSSTELTKKMAGKQVSLTPVLNESTEQLRGQSTPKDLRTLFELLYLRFQQPANDVDGYESLMAQVKMVLETAPLNPNFSYEDSTARALYDNDPRKTVLQPEDAANVSYEAVRKIYAERFNAAGDFDFVVTGAFDIDSLRLFTEQYVASLPSVKKREALVPVLKYHEGEKMVRYERKMETPQAFYRQFRSGEAKYSVKNEVALTALSSVMSQRYLKSIREDGGMAYSVSMYSQYNELTGKFLTTTVCPFTPAKVDSVHMLVNVEFDNITKNGVDDSELEAVRKFELKDLADSQRKNSYWQYVVMLKEIYGIDVVKGRAEAIENLKSEDIVSFVKQYILKQPNTVTVIMLPQDLTEAE